MTSGRGRRACAGWPRPTATGIATLIVAIVAALLATGAVAASPRVVAGWPRNVAAGTVHQGPGGGLVVISIGDATLEQGAQTVSAYRRDGPRLWSARRAPGCGNCDDGPQPAARQADGTYGPIGIEGDDFWAVDARGRIVDRMRRGRVPRRRLRCRRTVRGCRASQLPGDHGPPGGRAAVGGVG